MKMRNVETITHTSRPPGGEGSGGRLGPQWGTGAAPGWKQNGFEVFALAEIGSPESNANNPEYFE